MNPVYITGIGQTKVGEHWDKGLTDLSTEAIGAAMKDSGQNEFDAIYVANMASGILAGQENLAAAVADSAGLAGIEAIKVEAACGSAAAAFRQAVLAIASGQIQTAIVVGVEKLTELSGYSSSEALASAADAEYETAFGLNFVAINALLMQRYMHEYGCSREDFAAFSINSHRNASENPYAMFRKAITLQNYLSAKMIAEPIGLLDSSPIADGAAAIVVSAKPLSHSAASLSVAACEMATDTIALHDRENPLRLRGVQLSMEKALRKSNCKHSDFDFFEAHDAFGIMAALSLEASGFAEYGHAIKMANEGIFLRRSKMPVSTMGGLKGRGHPVGATGAYQLIEAVLQLRGTAPAELQIEDAKTALVQNIGGSGSNVVTTVLKRK